LIGTAHTNAADYIGDHWTFHDPNGNYIDASGTVNDVINKAAANISVNGYTVTYDGNQHLATGTATGLDGENLTSDLNFIGTAHTNAADYIGDHWTFHDPSGNYADASGTVNDVINQATANITINHYAQTYDGKQHSAFGTATGVDGENLSSDLNMSGTTHTNAGSYSDQWTFHDPSGNYADVSGTVKNAIYQATANISVHGYTLTYDGTQHLATGTATGVDGENLSSDLNLIGTAHTNAADYIGDHWTFHDPNGNYADVSGTVNDLITQATPTITVTGYSVSYNGNQHLATGTATGVNNENVSAYLNLIGTAHTGVANYIGDHWTFHDPYGNYTDASGTVNDVITPLTTSTNTI
jgi:hypothetical protein